jgi:hypothetical protein
MKGNKAIPDSPVRSKKMSTGNIKSLVTDLGSQGWVFRSSYGTNKLGIQG